MANQQNIDFQNVLTTHDQVKRLTDLLLFYANGSKDTTMGRWLIERVEITAGITTWDDKRKGQELASILWGWALSWWDSLDIFQIDKEVWANVEASFLRSFEPKHSAKIVCTNLQYLTQKPGESIHVLCQEQKDLQKFHGQQMRKCASSCRHHLHQQENLDHIQEVHVTLLPGPTLYCQALRWYFGRSRWKTPLLTSKPNKKLHWISKSSMKKTNPSNQSWWLPWPTTCLSTLLKKWRWWMLLGPSKESPPVTCSWPKTTAELINPRTAPRIARSVTTLTLRAAPYQNGISAVDAPFGQVRSVQYHLN